MKKQIDHTKRHKGIEDCYNHPECLFWKEQKNEWEKDFAILWAKSFESEKDLKIMLKFIRRLLSQEKEKALVEQKKEFISGKRCLSCGEKKEGKLTDMCDNCLEEN